MLVGGCDFYRQDLSVMMMLKDNYIWVCGGLIFIVVVVVKVVVGFVVKVEVECQIEEEVNIVIEVGVDVVMFDNFILDGV